MIDEDKPEKPGLPDDSDSNADNQTQDSGVDSDTANPDSSEEKTASPSRLGSMMPRAIKDAAETYAAKKRAMAKEQALAGDAEGAKKGHDKTLKKAKSGDGESQTAIDEIDAAIAASEYKKVIRKKRKKQLIIGSIAAVILFLSYSIWNMFQPYKGSVFYGVCKTFLELYVPYPETLRLSVVDEVGTYVRIWYAHTDSFGSYRLEPMVCHFEQDETYGWLLEKITVDRQPVPQERVEKFNKIVPLIYQNPPDLSLPWSLPDKLESLRFDRNSFIRPIL